MKRKYEIVYIFDSALEEPEVNEHLERFHELLKSSDQPEPITGIAHWGKRTLAYPIRKKEVGYYVVAHFETDTTLLSEFERVIKLDETVVRYLVVINEGLPATRPDQVDSEQTSAESKDSSPAPAKDAADDTPAKEAASDAPAKEATDDAPAVADASAETTDESSETAEAEKEAPSTDEGGE